MFSRPLFRRPLFRRGISTRVINAPIIGAFESHVIVKPSEQMKLFAFASEYNAYPSAIGAFKGLRPTCAITAYGAEPNQPMITAHITGTASHAIQSTAQLARCMKLRGMVPLRVKVEANAQCTGVPKTSNEMLHADFEEKYFEYHFKVQIRSPIEWERLAKLIAPTYGAHLFFNPYSQRGRFQPVVTMRRYGMGSVLAGRECDQLLATVESAGFKISSHIDREFSILDTSVKMDAGWLSVDANHPTRFLYHVPS